MEAGKFDQRLSLARPSDSSRSGSFSQNITRRPVQPPGLRFLSFLKSPPSLMEWVQGCRTNGMSFKALEKRCARVEHGILDKPRPDVLFAHPLL